MFKPKNPAQELWKSVKSLIGSIKQAPHYLLDNEYIHSGYRIGFNTWRQTLGSLFMLHNESVNVWSHLIGVFIFLIFIVYTAIKLGPKLDPDFHFEMTEQFNTLYQMIDDATFWDKDDIHNFTKELIRFDEFESLNFRTDHTLFYNITENFHPQCREENEVHDLSLLDYSKEFLNFEMVEAKLEYIMDRAETYIHSIVKGMQKLSKKIRYAIKITFLDVLKNS
jgi:hypothetical protein